jgi:uncharacterized protein (TIGR03663 family)
MQLNEPVNGKSTWLDLPFISNSRISWEITLFTIILVLAFFTRFYDLETRVMSHDETSHVYFSWLLYRGQGYAHDPVTHGPFQFHIVALSYFLFGDSDLTARIPAALFSIGTIAFTWAYRRYLGRLGALIAALLLLISPFLLYYGRYVRNEAFVGLFFMLNLWAVLRYLETGQSKFMYWLTLSTVLHFVTKETSFIYAAQTLLFLGLIFIYQVTIRSWEDRTAQRRFLLFLIGGLVLFTLTIGIWTLSEEQTVLPATETVDSLPLPNGPNILASFLIGLSILSAAIGIYYLLVGYGSNSLRKNRPFSLMLVLFTLVLPHLSPFALNFLKITVPVNMSQVNALQMGDILNMAFVIIPILLISIGIGVWWNARLWLINAGIFYTIFTVLFTTFFTNGAGFFTGLVGSLGYWLAQQEVERGSQPIYYYLLIQIPIYEYLPALGVILAAVLKFIKRPQVLYPTPNEDTEQDSELEPEPQESRPVFTLLILWTLTSGLAYTVAGEKMPWLTFHIVLPMILLAAWGINELVCSIDWKFIPEKNGWLSIAIIPIFVSAVAAATGSLLSATPPFQGQTLEQLSATSSFLISFLVAIASGVGIGFLMREWQPGQALGVFLLVGLTGLGFLTARTAFRAAYTNHDQATEYLVYAHSGPGVKIALKEIQELSERLTGTLDIQIAYDNDTTYPYWWYLRNYPKQRYFGGDPTRDLREAPAILVGDTNYARVEPIVGNAYHRFDYIRIWWPNQDYFDLTWERLINALTNPQLRQAIFKVWMNRDFSEYAQVTGKDMSLSNWYPSGRMRLYIRKDIANQIWQYGSTAAIPVEQDPYEGKEISIQADIILGQEGTSEGQFKKPRNIALAHDGTLYVADTENHRIQHLTPEGEVIEVWGRFADASSGEAPGGTFNEPWGIAVAPDGSVFVADTWNHRIQKFTSDGEFLTMWGFFGQAETPQSYWGPRAVAIGNNNRVYITDTGNKRILVFDLDGVFLTEFGISGFLPGEFSEPVGITVSSNGSIYIADTWNQRIQVMALDQTESYQPLRQWDIVGWYGQSLDNKPYLAIDLEETIYVTDPEGFHILEFSNTGILTRFWGVFGKGPEGLNLPTGIAVDGNGGVWVADSGNHRIVHFTLP